jgi:NADPH:quinone reductase-like Zn-dependent oxidoreductase
MSVDTAIINARKLLKPSGKLIIGRITRESLRYPLIFRTIDQPIEPILTEQKWDETLRSHGFSGVDYSLPDWQDAKDRSYSFICTTAKPASDETFPQEIFIIESTRASLQAKTLSEHVHKSLAARGISAFTTSLELTSALDVSGKAFIFLAEVENPLLFNICARDFEAVKRLILESASVTWVTRGGAMGCENPHMSLITGLSRTVRQENPGIALSTLDLDPGLPLDAAINATFIIKALRCNSIIGGDAEFAVRAGRIMIPRVHLAKGTNELLALHHTEPTAESALLKQADRALTLTVGVPGMLDTLYFTDDELHPLPLKPDDVEIEVKASGLNFMDVMVAMDQIQEPAVGLECSGIVSRVGSAVSKFKSGDRVMTWMLGAFSNFARNPESMFQFIPEEMTFEIAASLPMIYCTAYQALVEAARLQNDDKILIHAAAGGVGQAAIMIAQHIGAEIFITVGSQAKKKHIMETYQIPEDHIFNSRDTSFAKGIKRMTQGKGVDVVLNSLAGEALRQSWLCLAWFGRFVELGKKDISKFTFYISILCTCLQRQLEILVLIWHPSSGTCLSIQSTSLAPSVKTFQEPQSYLRIP